MPPAALLFSLLLFPQGDFFDPATRLVPFPLPPGARFDKPLSGAVRELLTAMGGKGKERVLAYLIDEEAEKVRDYYTHLLPLKLKPVTVDVASVLARAPSFNGPPAKGTMKGFADGGLLILRPYYDFSRHQWCPDRTLILILQ